ncbi:MAG TPA: Gfo/Idh/MocA family oxidoreductase [Vicinamibacterales bacterium]|nr:Gfo/Idh/MocA family oxidoreductase [Vicinamibacterales bacterium]
MHIGILGAGNISDTHTRAAREIPGVRVVAVCGRTRERAEALAGRAGATPYTDVQQFLAHRPMDLVAIGSPSGLHAGHAIPAVRQGLHVVVEKPLDISVARVDELAAEAERAGVKVGVFFQDRLKPDVRRMKSLVDSGRLGTPVLASGHVKWYRPPEYYGGSRWRGTWALDGGGALMNQGIHTADLLLHLFGDVVSVSARAATRVHRIEVEDTVVAALEFESGALGVLEAATSIYPGYARRLELTGVEGTLILDHDRLAGIDLKTPSDDRPTPPDGAGAQSAASPIVGDATPHRRILEDFLNAIATGGRPACDAREGRRSVALVEAIYRSARENRPVPVDRANA